MWSTERQSVWCACQSWWVSDCVVRWDAWPCSLCSRQRVPDSITRLGPCGARLRSFLPLFFFLLHAHCNGSQLRLCPPASMYLWDSIITTGQLEPLNGATGRVRSQAAKHGGWRAKNGKMAKWRLAGDRAALAGACAGPSQAKTTMPLVQPEGGAPSSKSPPVCTCTLLTS